MHRTYLSPLAAAFLLTWMACASEPDATDPAAASEVTPAVGTAYTGPDTSGAAVWAFLGEADYQSTWALWPGKGELYAGQEPHGMLLTTYLNPAAMEALQGGASVMPTGAVIVKENYMPDSTLAAVTVMVKVPGYNPEHSDWFFTKHLPDGALDQSPEGMPMEGRLAGCQNCHAARAANDYLYTSDLGGPSATSN